MPDPGVLDELPILRFLPDETRAQIVRRFVPETFPFGGVLAAEGEAADALYVLVSGRARVVKRTDNGDEIPLNVLQRRRQLRRGRAASTAGRIRPRSAPASDVLALRLDRSAFQELRRRRPRHPAPISSCSSNTTRCRGSSATSPRSPGCPPRPSSASCSPSSSRRWWRRARSIVGEGDPRGPLYLIEEGRVRVMRQVDGAPQYLGELRRGRVLRRGVGAQRRRRAASTVEALTRVPPARARPRNRAAAGRRAARVPHAARGAHRAVRLQERGARRPRASTRSCCRPAPTAQEQVGDVAGRSDGRRAPMPPTRRPFEDEGRFIKRRRRVRRMRFVRQIDEMDCGAACLAMVAQPLRPRGVAGAHPAAGEHRPRRHQPALAVQRRRGAGAGGAVGQGVAAESRSHAAAGHLPLGRRPLARALSRHADATPTSPIRRSGSGGCRARSSSAGGPATRRCSTTRRPSSRRRRAAAGLAWLWPHRHSRTPALIVRALGLAVVVSVLQMVLPVFTQVIVDRVLVEQDLSLLRLLIVAMGGDDGVHRRVARWRSAICSVSRPCASTPPGSTSSPGGCWRCRCPISPRGGPATCSAASKACGRSATSSCSTASPASPRWRSSPSPWR